MAETKIIATRPCPICGKPGRDEWRPFCSKRCADVDLNRWLSGVYSLPAAAIEEEDEERPPGERDTHDEERKSGG
jgi:endogenous inhibitor of DNA gyrase (YacG/DUF329 family)